MTEAEEEGTAGRQREGQTTEEARRAKKSPDRAVPCEARVRGGERRGEERGGL